MTRITLKPIADQVMVITGASSGIGMATAKAAAANGARVMLVSRNAAAMAAIVAEIEAAGGTAAYAVADVGVVDQVRAAATKAIDTFGRIDTWVNDAGVAIYASLIDTPLDEHEQLFRTNYFGVVHGATVAVGHLKDRGGALITIGSIAGDMPSPVMGAYTASKHAIKGYIESLRTELALTHPAIAITLIKPSGIDTPIAEHAANHVEGEAMIPPPVYDPALVAAAILDAAEHPRRNVTVGGIGRLQVLVATHFPGLYARWGGLTQALLHDPGKPPTPSDNLSSPVGDGHERSSITSGRRVSLYAALRRYRTPLAITASAVAALTLHRRSQNGRA